MHQSINVSNNHLPRCHADATRSVSSNTSNFIRTFVTRCDAYLPPVLVRAPASNDPVLRARTPRGIVHSPRTASPERPADIPDRDSFHSFPGAGTPRDKAYRCYIAAYRASLVIPRNTRVLGNTASEVREDAPRRGSNVNNV